ncbi:MAG: hypothetical protein ACMX3H_03240 [Sodalis sp. (in: enterobacteria)]|uniref:hypothetical protein n=1 Tax=Sodalis sp. (in: enterobacteria) TaxID=1898979 RepID=UPI0039E5EB1C
MISADYSFTAKTPIEHYHLSALAAEINNVTLVNDTLTLANGAAVKMALPFKIDNTYLITLKQVTGSGTFIDGSSDFHPFSHQNQQDVKVQRCLQPAGEEDHPTVNLHLRSTPRFSFTGYKVQEI